MASNRSAEPSATISLRISESNLARIDAARTVSNQTRTDFILLDAIRRADEVLLNQTLVVLDAEAFQRVLDVLDSNEAATANMINLMHKPALWD